MLHHCTPNSGPLEARSSAWVAGLFLAQALRVLSNTDILCVCLLTGTESVQWASAQQTSLPADVIGQIIVGHCMGDTKLLRVCCAGNVILSFLDPCNASFHIHRYKSLRCLVFRLTASVTKSQLPQQSPNIQ